MSNRKKIKCPHCGYYMPVFYEPSAQANGIYIQCKGRNCKKIFEINNNILTQAPVINENIQS